jgi:hypothetical protein
LLLFQLQEEVQSVGSLLATRCEAYDLLYDQLVRHVGLEGRGGPSTLVLNHNSAAANPNTTITANPTNTTTASSTSTAQAVNKGLGGAAIAAAGLAGGCCFWQDHVAAACFSMQHTAMRVIAAVGVGGAQHSTSGSIMRAARGAASAVAASATAEPNSG